MNFLIKLTISLIKYIEAYINITYKLTNDKLHKTK